MNIRANIYKGVILDMDGVITRTAALHAQAWKKMFDGVLEKHSGDGGEPQEPFDAVDDYRAYVDGKPRLEGLQSFLEVRDIKMPWGAPDDPAGAETVHGLGKLKNRFFLDLVKKEGVDIFPESVLLAGRARIADLPMAVVTSSKNGPLIMEQSGLMSLFDTLVDGNVAAELSLKGKPEPDIMLESARRLGTDPAHAMLFEDAISGVQAGRAAGMRLVVGVARDRNERQLVDAGADVVVHGLGELKLLSDRPRPLSELGSALEAVEVLQVIASCVPRTVFFLDYDGTLTPIVERPELATLDQARRDTLAGLVERHAVAVVSGRGLDDVRSLVGLDGLFYAGSHGLEVAGPEGEHISLEHGREYESRMDELERDLRRVADEYEGVIIERKRFSVAVHFRLASPEAESSIAEAIERVMSKHEGLRKQEGKKVIEVRPDIDWDKGRAVEWLLNTLGIDTSRSLVIYIGDDSTDEDAFRALQGRGLSIVVRDPDPDSGADYKSDTKETFADLAVENTEEVYAFLQMFGPEAEESMGVGGGRG